MRRARAFTLMELMAVLAIAGALTFVAASNWPAYWQRKHRAAARAALVGALSQLELRHASTGTYEGTPGPMPYVDGYIITEQPCASRGISVPRNQCIEVVAKPGQPDKVCGNLVLRSTGEREPHNSTCWP
ncbi:type IV pilin protein [Ralstonia sp. SET104]|jgi:type IV pilus assembly protein PilE|uniref:type IV pilin protein n=1 Tax=Ralstonia sp. SET104 TaxID=2448774 RepID=UPI000F55BBE1|nr:prepilin-type N-terminal cleavage/methylation domain-containing protein [Ralstonia sp. SET104]GCB04120.1 hypothetical protein PSUB009319_17510 [Ralstonia sp. SET104]